MVNEEGRRLHLWLGIAISIASILAILALIEPAEVLEALRAADAVYLLLSLPGALLFLVVRAARWRFLLNNQPTWGQTFHIQNIGYLLTYLLPFRIGDVARVVLMGSVRPLTVTRAATTAVVERILDMLTIVTLLPFTLAQVERLPGWLREGALVAGFVALAGVLILIAAASQPARLRQLTLAVCRRVPFLDADAWGRRVEGLLQGLSTLRRPRDGLVLGLLSILVWLPVVVSYYVGVRAVGLSLTPAAAAFVVCVAALSVAAPSSPGQVGVYHFAVTVALSEALGYPRGAAVSFAILMHALNLVLALVLGVVGLHFTHRSFGDVVTMARQFVGRRRRAAAVDEQV